MGDECVVKIIEALQEEDISDFHLREGSTLYYREEGRLKRFDYELTSNDFADLVGSQRFESYLNDSRGNEMDFSLELASMRYRCNMFTSMGRMGLVMRRIVSGVKTIDEMGLPTSFKKVAAMKSGLVIISGPTGSGDSGIIMIDTINPIKSRFKGFHKTFKQDDSGLNLSSFILN